jgi:hypothetical protein
MNTTETVELTDLEPTSEVKGGTSGGTALPSAPVVDLQFNQQNDTLASGITKFGSKRLVLNGDGTYQG